MCKSVVTEWLHCGCGGMCSPSSRKPLPVRLTDETSDPVVDVADSLVCRGLAKYLIGDLLISISHLIIIIITIIIHTFILGGAKKTGPPYLVANILKIP